MKTMKIFCSENRRPVSSVVAAIALFGSLMVAMFIAPAHAAIVFIGSSSGSVDVPTNGTAGSLTIPAPAGVTAGRALIASIAARPHGMTVTVPPGWSLMTSTQQTVGGISTDPGGMNLLTYYKIATVSEPASYTWTFANTIGLAAPYCDTPGPPDPPNYFNCDAGGSAVGGLLVFSGIDTAGGNPIDGATHNAWTALNVNGAPHTTTSFTPPTPGTMIVSSISYLSASSFANPTSSAGCITNGGQLTERLDQRFPSAYYADIGTTIQMSTAYCPTATATGAVTAVIQPGPNTGEGTGADDSGVGHLMALKPSAIDLDLSMTRSGPLVPGNPVSYVMTVTNNGTNPEPGTPVTIVVTLPPTSQVTYSSGTGTNWNCGAPTGPASGPQVVCTRNGAVGANGGTIPTLTITVNVTAGAIGTVTNTATVSGQGGDGNTANNTAVDNYTFATDLAITKTSGTLNPGQNGTYTLNVSNVGTLQENGPITITDVLPAQLTYVSAIGAGWSCGVSVQTVTCTRAGTLAAGAAAGAVTLTVAVSQTAFSVSNTASVAGTSGDANSANNSSTANYTMSADLDMTKIRTSGPLVPLQNATYTLTVTNNGPNAAPQPVTISDPLPPQLTFVSATGTGWTCNATVSCTLAGPLASGASSTVTLTVTVAAGSSGSTVTNTASVSGTATDGTPGNNSDSDSYFIPVQSYAYYAMDEASWNGTTGEVKDSSGNTGRDATAQAVSTIATPASAPKGDTCRGADIPDNDATLTRGVNTPIDINDLGTAGTISFWYRSNLSWNAPGNSDNDDRTLFDATGATDGEFWLVLRKEGSLRFRLDSSGGAARVITTSNFNSIGGGTWVHVAVTWSFNPSGNRFMRIYVNGAQEAERFNNDVTSTNNYGALFVGDTIAITNDDNRGNSADGAIDEVRLYDFAMSSAQITADMNATHACVSVDHYELSLAASSITCLPTTVVVTACANTSSPCTSSYAAASGTTANLATVGGSLGATTVTFNASGIATTTLSYPAASNGATATVTLSGETLPFASPRQCCQGGSCSTANSCATTFNTAGFIFSDTAGGAAATLPAQSAGISSGTYYLRAVRTSTTTQACEAALTGVNTVSFGYECNDPTTCYGANLMSVNGGSATTIARNDNGSVSSYTPVSMTFDANGNAPFTFNYSDVGLVTLHATKAAGGSLLSALSGASDDFVVKPHHFDLSAIACTTANAANCAPGALPSGNNPGAADASGASFIQAGNLFSVTVTARDAAGNPTRNYGKETSPEGVTLTHTKIAPAAGNNPALANPAAFGAFTNGVATGTTFRWDEVGIITLTPGIGDGNYLGAGNVSGTASGNVGRFIPAYFDLVLSPGCAAGNFTYSGQPFAVTAMAYNAGGNPTQNYDSGGGNGFAKDVTITAPGNPNNFNVGPPAGNVIRGASRFGNGVGDTFPVTNLVTGPNPPIVYTFPVKETEPLTPSVLPAPPATPLRAIDTDGVSSLNHAEPQIDIRSGRVRVINAYGSELVPLSLPVRVEYFMSDSWVTNPDDNCTTLSVTNLDLENATDDPAAGDDTITIRSIPDPPNPPIVKSSTVTVVAPANGTGSLDFTAPGANGFGYADATMLLPGNAWLKYDWDGDTTADDPVGRAGFGLFRGSRRHIYQRERY